MVIFALISDQPDPTMVRFLVEILGLGVILDLHAAGGTRVFSDNHCLSAKSY